MSSRFRSAPSPVSRHAAVSASTATAAVVIRAVAFAVALAALGACSSDDDDDGGGLSDDLSGTPSGDDTSPDDAPSGDTPSDDDSDEDSGAGTGDEPPASVSLISRDNHVELIGEAFDLYVGRPYTDDVVQVVHPAVRGNATGEVSSVTVCDNGGTVTVVAEGRVAFDDCQLGEAVFDGIGEAPFNPFGWHLVAEALVVERSPGRRLELAGDMRRLSGDRTTAIETWQTSEATIRLVTPEGTVSVSDATSSFDFGLAVAGEGFDPIYAGGVSGGFTFRSPLTDDRPIRAEIPVVFSRPTESSDEPFGVDDDFTVGQLRLAAEDGSTVLLDAATGDETTVTVEIVVDGESERFVQPWSLWHERLRFDEPPEN